MRNLLQEFQGNHGLRPPTILGVREHVFTGRFVFVFLQTLIRFVALVISLNNSVMDIYM